MSKRTPAAADQPDLADRDTELRLGATAIADASGRIRAASTAFASAFGIRRDELFAHPLTTQVRDEDRPALAHALRAVTDATWPSCTLEVRVLQHVREDRTIRLVLEGNAPQRVRIRATDLTLELTTARSQREYEASLRALTAHSLDIWALLSESGSLRSVSESISLHLGWTPDQLEGRPVIEILHADERDAVGALMQSLRADPAAVRTGTVRARHRDGGWRTLEMTISGLNAPVLGNRVFVLNARDVTAREGTEAALREAEYRFSRLVEQARTGIVVIQQGRLAYANPRFLELLGLAPESLPWRPRFLSLLHRESIPALRNVRAALAMGSQSTRLELRGRHTSGRSVEVDVAASVVDFQGSPALLCTVTDMTEGRALQLKAAEAEKIEAVGLLASGVAHDFNNMLTGIMAWVDIASDELGDANPITNALEEIRTSAERAAELTQQLLAFGRRQLLAPGPLDLGEVTVRLKRWIDRVLGPDHRIAVDIPDSPWLVEADRSQIERALTTLIMHARDATPAGGEIRVRVSHETLSRERAEAIGPLTVGEHVVVSVRDEGAGMDETTRQRVFEPFFTTRQSGSGTGLGLAAVLGTVLQSRGGIDVYSEPGTGTEIRCYFPRLRRGSERQSGPARATAVAAWPARNVLVVEDDVQLGKMLRRMLQEHGHAVRLAVVAGDAGDAGSQVASDRADVIVCDVELPGMRGSTLAGLLRSRGVVDGAVLISGRQITADELAEAGERTIWLRKPFRSHHLLDAVEEAARRTDEET